MSDPSSGPPGADRPDEEPQPRSTVHDPAKLLRVGRMLAAVRSEISDRELDERSRDHLVTVQQRARAAVTEVLAGDLVTELDALVATLPEQATRSELRLAQAELLGWLEGLLQVLQQMAGRQQQQDVARQIAELQQAQGSASGDGGTGHYL